MTFELLINFDLGDFSLCQVLLGSNNLTKLESSVFKSVLEQMDATDIGFFTVEKSTAAYLLLPDFLFLTILPYLFKKILSSAIVTWPGYFAIISI